MSKLFDESLKKISWYTKLKITIQVIIIDIKYVVKRKWKMNKR